MKRNIIPIYFQIFRLWKGKSNKTPKSNKISRNSSFEINGVPISNAAQGWFMQIQSHYSIIIAQTRAFYIQSLICIYFIVHSCSMRQTCTDHTTHVSAIALDLHLFRQRRIATTVTGVTLHFSSPHCWHSVDTISLDIR